MQQVVGVERLDHMVHEVRRPNIQVIKPGLVMIDGDEKIGWFRVAPPALSLHPYTALRRRARGAQPARVSMWRN